MLKSVNNSKSILTISISALIILLALIGASWQKGYAETTPTVPVVDDDYEPKVICVNSDDTQVTVYGSDFINFDGEYFTSVSWDGPTNVVPVEIVADEINADGTMLKFTLTTDLLTEIGPGTFTVINHPDFGDPEEVGDPKTINIISCIYLPIVLENSKSVYPLLNGNFESGSDGSWKEYSNHGWDLIINPSEGLPVTPHSGNYAVWMGGDLEEISRLSQYITISPSLPYVHFWYWIASEDNCGHDYFQVKINDIQTLQVNLCSDNNTGKWVENVVNLSSYSGSSVLMVFEVTTNDALYSSFFLDDVSLSNSSTVSSAVVGETQSLGDLTEGVTISR